MILCFPGIKGSGHWWGLETTSSPVVGGAPGYGFHHIPSLQFPIMAKLGIFQANLILTNPVYSSLRVQKVVVKHSINPKAKDHLSSHSDTCTTYPTVFDKTITKARGILFANERIYNSLNSFSAESYNT